MIRIPVRLVSLANRREHWAVRARRARQHRNTAYALMLRHARPLPAVVTITRIAPRALDDDNLAISAKSVRDGIADAYRINDRDPRIQWRYAQRRGAPHEYSVEVEIA